MNWRIIRLYGLLLAGAFLVSCESESFDYADLRIYDHPYAEVDWYTDVRLKAQHHDHFGADSVGILAYDQAGYDVLSLMDYSGHPTAPYALRHRLWPPSQFVEPWVSSSLQNVRLFVPNAEEVGLALFHMTTPFLDQYIEAASGTVPADAQAAEYYRRTLNASRYSTVDEAFELVRRFGGVPCLAHPRTIPYDHITGVFCTEIYTAFEEASGGLTRGSLLPHWDAALARNQKIWGIAVNDHFGPGRTHAGVRAEGMDSGKIVVLAHTADLESYKDAFTRGAILAVKDLGLVKDLVPDVYEISVATDHVHIETPGEVTWIAHGAVAAHGSTLYFSELRPGWRYVRAEIGSTNGSVVYTQAFSVRPRGDVDGDYDVDAADTELCSQVAAGVLQARVYVEAC